MGKIIYGLILAGLVAGCSSGGGGGGGGAPAGPADSVNSKLTSSAVGAFTGQTALFESSRGQNNGQSHAQPRHVLGLTEMAAMPPVNSEKAAVQAKVDRLNRVLYNGACKFETKNPTNTTNGVPQQFQPMQVKISGAGCPLELSLQISIDGMGGASPCTSQGAMTCRFSGQVKMSYQVLDAKLATDLQVRSGHVNLSFDIDQKMPDSSMGSGGPIESEFKNKAVFDFKAVDLEGHAHLISGSQDMNIKMVMDPSSQGQTSAPQIYGGMKEDLQYLDEASGVKSTLSAVGTANGGKPEGKFFVDGNSVTESAYMTERNKFANSMMGATGESQENSNQTGSSDPTAQPQQPLPQPQPQPQPLPEPPPHPPAPVPQPPTGGGAWACVIQDYSTSDVFIGYGPQEFVASSKAKQACQASGGSNCEFSAKCEVQESNPQAWYCETKNYSNSRVFGGVGASKIEASYSAKKECLAKSNSSGSSCSNIAQATCVHQ